MMKTFFRMIPDIDMNRIRRTFNRGYGGCPDARTFERK